LRRTIFVIVIIFAVSLSLSAEENDLLKIEVSMNPERLSRGQEGKLILKFTVEEGINISPHPFFTIELNPSKELIFPKNFFSASDMDIGILKKNGEEYLNINDPVEIPFAVNLEAERGNHIIEGKVKYFACCKKEGWCLKNISKFSASFYTRNRTVRKKK